MPREKDFKRLVRDRMAKTGESYTAARSQILTKPTKQADRPAVRPPNYEVLSGIANRRLEERTGCTWERRCRRSRHRRQRLVYGQGSRQELGGRFAHETR